ncbi:iron-sulfur cluster assembly accessory protein [Leptolyngbya sp. FACHB-261]|nr:iron-sulfur cluster assembly accessory protein [Leptolyngbya sp. FACHB-261]
MINLTPAAAREVKRLKARFEDPATGLRLGVQNSGCSGMSYTMNFDSEARPDDVVYDCEGIRVVVDAASLSHINGLTLDYSEDLMGGGFRFHNPQATHSCGCGSSFSTAQEAQPQHA